MGNSEDNNITKIGRSEEGISCPVKGFDIAADSNGGEGSKPAVNFGAASSGKSEFVRRREEQPVELRLVEEREFLEFVAQNPCLFVTQIYRAMGLSGYKGDKLKTNLLEKGLIRQEITRAGDKGRAAKVLVLTDEGVSAMNESSNPGENSGVEVRKVLKNKQIFRGAGGKIKGAKAGGKVERASSKLRVEDSRAQHVRPEEGLWGVHEVSSYLRVSVHTVYSWVSQGRIPHFKLGGVLRFRREDILAWLEEKKCAYPYYSGYN